MRKHVEMSSGPYTGANIIVWAISWRENREGDDVENREGDDVGPEAQSCTTRAIQKRCPERQTRVNVSDHHQPRSTISDSSRYLRSPVKPSFNFLAWSASSGPTL